jgi:hypothetical protein
MFAITLFFVQYLNIIICPDPLHFSIFDGYPPDLSTLVLQNVFLALEHVYVMWSRHGTGSCQSSFSHHLLNIISTQHKLRDIWHTDTSYCGSEEKVERHFGQRRIIWERDHPGRWHADTSYCGSKLKTETPEEQRRLKGQRPPNKSPPNVSVQHVSLFSIYHHNTTYLHASAQDGRAPRCTASVQNFSLLSLHYYNTTYLHAKCPAVRIAPR